MNMRNIHSLLFLLVSSFISTLNAQIIIKNGSVTSNTCGGVFYDSGGATGNYKANETYTFTIYSDDPSHSHISLGFDLLDILTGDELCFFDGPTTNSPLLACASDMSNGQNAIIQATAENPKGCITVRFRSNGSGQGRGWAANIMCIPSCQTIKAFVDATYPPMMPADTGWINVCPNDTKVNFKAHGIYPQNGYAYAQSDNLNKFEWNFDDGSPVVYGTDVTHVFKKSGGYTVRLTITDTVGCQNINYIKQRVRVSPRPNFRLGSIPSQVCAGTEIKLKAQVGAIDTLYQVSSTQNEGSFQLGGVRSEPLFIPDDPSKEYKTSIFFTDFGPGQTLTNVNNILDVFVEMEHSWARDLEIKLVCPNRKSVILHKYDLTTRNKNEIHIGIPNENDAVLPEFVNVASMNPAGKGLRYEWTPTAANTWRSYTTPSPVKLPSGKYKPDGSLNSLVGCPLNGEWSLVVKDQFQYDNGWIFAWGIDFAKGLYPKIETFTPQVVEHGWVKDELLTKDYANDYMSIVPKNTGVASAVYRIKDDYNCTFDTAVNINVVACLPCSFETLLKPLKDTAICRGSGVGLNTNPANSNTTGLTFAWSPATNLTCTNCSNPTATPSVTTTYTVTVTDGANCQYIDDVVVTVTDSIAAPQLSIDNVNFTFIIFGWDAIPGINSYEVSINNGPWIAPNGALFHVVKDLNIGDVVNFRVRAVTTSACGAKISSVTQATKKCVASIGNGADRRLEIDPIKCNALTSEKVNFRFANGIAPFTFIIDSINNGQSPIFLNNIKAGNHTAILIDSTGCSDTLKFTVIEPNPLTLDLTATSVKCYGEDTLKITANVTGGNGIYNYRLNTFILGEWRNTPVFDSLTAGYYTIEVRDTNGCSISRDTEIVSPSLLILDIAKQDLRCFGDSIGYVTSTVSGGVLPYTWRWSNGNTTDQINNLKAGNYSVTVTDKNGCAQVATTDIEQNNEIKLIVTADSAKCYGEETGRIQINSTGGLAPFTYYWSNNYYGDINNGLKAGSYRVTATDALGCIRSTSAVVYQPDTLRFDSLVTVNTKCPNEATGTARAFVSGGVLPYEFTWTPTNRVGQAIVGLDAGDYISTVKDANGCIVDQAFTIKSNSKITLDQFSVVNPIKCFGDKNTQLSVKASGGAGGFTYKWNTTPVQTTLAAQNIGAGAYSVTITDANNCSIVADTTLTEPSKLDASVSSYTDVRCKGEANGTATPSVIGGTPFPVGIKYNYQWSDNQTTPVAIGLGVGLYTLTATDANGCQDTATIYISEPATFINAIARQTKLGCYNQNTGEATVDVTGGSGSYTYLWSNLQRTQTVANLANQAYFVTVTDVNGCQAMDTVDIVNYDSIKISVSLTAPKCYGFKNGLLKIDSISGGASNGNLNNFTYRWSTSPIQTASQAVNLAGNITYKVTVVDNQGCQNIASYFLQEPNRILLAGLSKNVSCYGGNDGEAEVQVTGQKPPFSYQWDQNANAQITARASGLVAGKFTVRVTDSVNCSIDTTITLTQPTPLKIQNPQITTAKCTNDATGKIELSVTGGTPQYIYQWSNGGNTPTIQNLRAGTYDFTVIDANNCRLSQTFSVTAPNALDGEVSAENIRCYGEANGKITIDAFGGTQPYLFSIDGKTYNGINQIVALRAGKYDVFVKDANNCIWFETAQITQPARFAIEAMPDVTINLGDSIQLFANAQNSQGVVDFTWKAPYENTLSCTKCLSPISKPGYTITYAIQAVDSAGCRATDSVKVSVVKPRYVLVPTGFTPNNDQVNDRLVVRGKEGTKIVTFRVYDRWGELVYEAQNFKINDENTGWDGMFRGLPMMSGLYVWYVEAEYIDGAKEIIKGNTTLIR